MDFRDRIKLVPIEEIDISYRLQDGGEADSKQIDKILATGSVNVVYVIQGAYEEGKKYLLIKGLHDYRAVERIGAQYIPVLILEDDEYQVIPPP